MPSKKFEEAKASDSWDKLRKLARQAGIGEREVDSLYDDKDEKGRVKDGRRKEALAKQINDKVSSSLQRRTSTASQYEKQEAKLQRLDPSALRRKALLRRTAVSAGRVRGARAA